jgi:hypothetical protein
MQLGDAPAGGDHLHGPADEAIGTHAILTLFVGHEHLVGAHPHLQCLGQPDVGGSAATGMIGIVSTEVDVAVERAWEDEFS